MRREYQYQDNLIGKDVPLDVLDLKIRTLPKAKGWIPVETYDMVQCGYPLPDHGEMIIRTDGGTNEKGELLPATGMWCKVKDVMEILNNEKEITNKEEVS